MAALVAVAVVLNGSSIGAESRAAEPVAAPAVRRLGTNELVAGRFLTYLAPLNAYARSQLGQVGLQTRVAQAAVVLPEGWDAGPPVPILVVCSSSGSPAIPQMRGYTNAALAGGWAVLAADGPQLSPDRDTVLWNWGLVGSALEYFQGAVPKARLWPVAVGGFSGGAKRAACVAAALAQSRRQLLGVFMGGCNEDRATTGALLYQAGPAFHAAPMFLSNGRSDPIAGPAHGASVRAQMERSGFSRVRSETYDGGHRLSSAQLADALSWFLASRSPGATKAPVSTLR
ncbi:MAG: hypothetical protein AB7O66_24355 [Limisphaerales bacterium]